MANSIGSTLKSAAGTVKSAVKSAVTSTTKKQEEAAPPTGASAVKVAEKKPLDAVEKKPLAAPDAQGSPRDAGPLQAKATGLPPEVAASLAGEARAGVTKAEVGGVVGGVAAEPKAAAPTLAGGLRDLGGRVTDLGRQVKDAVGGAVGKPAEECARAGQQLAALGQRMQKATPAVIRDAGGLSDKIRSLGEKVLSTADKVTDQGAPGPVALGREAMEKVKDAGRRVADVARQPAPGVEVRPDTLQRVKDLGRKVAEAASPRSPLVGADPAALPERLKEAGRKAINTAKDVAEFVDAAANPERQVDKLKPGDKFTFSGGASGNVAVPGTPVGIKMGQKGTYEVECRPVTDPKTGAPVTDAKTGKPQVRYVVSFEGDASAGVGVSKDGRGAVAARWSTPLTTPRTPSAACAS
jgi:hypothetical protein